MMPSHRAAAPDAPAPSRTRDPPDEEDSEAPGPPDGPTPPCPAIHALGPNDATLPPRRYHHEDNKTKCKDRRMRTTPRATRLSTGHLVAGTLVAGHQGGSTTTTGAVRVPPSSPSPCAFAFPSSLSLFSKKMAGSNVDGDEAAESRRLNRRTSSSLHNGSRVT